MSEYERYMRKLFSLDRAAEIARDADIDAGMPFQILDSKPFVYDKDSWFADCANYMVGTPEQMDEVRIWLRDALYWIEDGLHDTPKDKVRSAKSLGWLANQIGWQVIKAALESPLTQEILGERTL